MMPFPVVSFPLLYAETHYRFKYFFSYLKQSEPEILADIPHRLEPSSPLPILLLIKDSDRFPITLDSVKIELRQNASIVHTSDHALYTRITDKIWWKVLAIPFDNEIREIFGHIDVDVHIRYTIGGVQYSSKNDNHKTSSKKSLRFYRSEQALPTLAGWIQGDTHTHSSYTDDQVEFGAPIGASVELSKAMGLTYFCVTDHSYDLDDRVDNFLINDPELPKWKLQQKEIEEINLENEHFAVVRGEEVSCFNSANRNVHLLLWGTKKFFAGSGDGAEKWFRTKAEHTIRDILVKKERSVVAYAGHPTEPAPFFQWLLIKRGTWGLDDMDHDGLAGVQVLNGEINHAFFKGMEYWVTLLLRGKRIFIAAGNDAHGNFNRFKQIGIPFFTIREHDRQLFGKMRTALQVPSTTEAAILESLQLGHSVITSGPLVIFSVINESGERAAIGERIRGARLKIHIQGTTTNEFGAFSELRIIAGTIGTTQETVRIKREFLGSFAIDSSYNFEILRSKSLSYLRIEACTFQAHIKGAIGFCYTNPIWIQHL